MKYLRRVTPLIAAVMFASPATIALGHAGHGDEFEATGGVGKVEVKPATDQQLGIQVQPITATADGKIMIPATAVVDANGKTLVFVKFKSFYEPVEVTTGQTEGELIEVTKNLSVDELLVTQGGLMLYAQSRKTAKSPATEAQPKATGAVATPKTEAEHQQAHAEGSDHDHEHVAAGLSKKKIAAAVGGVMAIVAVGAGAVVMLGRRKKGAAM
ncbi:cobalt transporter [filamentous cyanobacterium LEGE 11480]|uniref:Cobalt transporter n=1 Tax=Romeriopsis navalis LEGE 11480 TaxID=2777977 RepID=A0A928VRV9_9CYAN|nr:cobalt transporter [Romeriopsis navalis]MBE9032633.1 cobalt transporter [Romeriopsis navalis LEGE 11480]